MDNKLILNKETDQEITFRSFTLGRLHLEVPSRGSETIVHIMLTEEQSKELLSFLKGKHEK
ncbi:hypothetical protein SAMN04489761_4655 [Tenacibaculum sp. MAR_2009_124]|uniref:hypothetical protein n=1 Tax=Tenacibaculum sp. MAR_2009_124 TaxID=1250059 RepID=UPI00089A66BD|nr:hypothetical protein [Tenacibaculum sp. MAR_2009_124]SED21675.1 hypothetical protein SAMN04489761_4655 [Tenacibaculum sp. MAR_2009_124]